MIGVGSAIPISVCLGKKEGEEANNIFTCACIMIVGTGILIGGLLFAVAPLLIHIFRYIWLGNLGGRIGYVYQHDGMRTDCVFTFYT